MASAAQDWQQNKSLVECNKFMFENRGLVPDITFQVKDSAGQWVSVSANKYVLLLRSPVFFNQFSGAARHGATGAGLKILDIDDESFTELLRFLYYDQVNLKPEIVMSVMHAAKKYGVPALGEKCTQYLEAQVNANNVCTILENSVKFDVPEIQLRCLELVKYQASVVLQSPTFGDVSHQVLQMILQCGSLNCTELQVFQGCLRWAKAECERRGLPLEPAGYMARQVLGDALFLIRFSAIPMANFAQEVVKSGILTTNEENLMYRVLSGAPVTESLPFPTGTRTNPGTTVTCSSCRQAVNVNVVALQFNCPSCGVVSKLQRS